MKSLETWRNGIWLCHSFTFVYNSANYKKCSFFQMFHDWLFASRFWISSRNHISGISWNVIWTSKCICTGDEIQYKHIMWILWKPDFVSFIGIKQNCFQTMECLTRSIFRFKSHKQTIKAPILHYIDVIKTQYYVFVWFISCIKRLRYPRLVKHIFNIVYPYILTSLSKLWFLSASVSQSSRVFFLISATAFHQCLTFYFATTLTKHTNK